MAEVLRTADHSVHFGTGNFREVPNEGVLQPLCAVAPGQRVTLVLNGVRGTWERWAKGSLALKKVDEGARRSWDVPVGTWLQITIEPPGVVRPDPAPPKPAGPRSAGPAGPAEPRPAGPAQGTEPHPVGRTGSPALSAAAEPPPPLAGAGSPAPPATRVVYACDVGTTLQRPPNFGWARAAPAHPQHVVGSRSIEALAVSLRQDLAAGLSVALGFESPLFLPVPNSSGALSRARGGEAGMAWSAPAGASVTTLGVHQAAWILREAYAVGGGSHQFTTDWGNWPGRTRPVLFCWEAMVCGTAHSPTNDPTHDAATAVAEFLASERDLDRANAVTACPTLSLIHAVALWSGWSSDVAGLHGATLVIRPCARHPGASFPP